MVATAKRAVVNKTEGNKTEGEKLDRSTRDKLATCARNINAAKEKEFISIFDRGDWLGRANGLLANHGDGTFWKWVSDNCQLGKSQGSRYMRAARAVPVHNDRAIVAQTFDMTALWELTKPDAPPKAIKKAISAANGGKRIHRKDAERLVNAQRKVERAATVVELPERVQLVCCDLREIRARMSIEPASVDVLLCDPLYGKDDLLMYRDIAKLAANVLRPGGWCLCYAGKMFINRVHAAMSTHLEYAWTFDVIHKKPTVIDNINIAQRAKYVVGFRFQPSAPWWGPFSDRLEFAAEKVASKLQQPVEEAEYLLGNLCPKGGIVLDPCCGTGTTGVAAAQLGLPFIGGDNNPEMIEKAKGRLATMRKGATA